MQRISYHIFLLIAFIVLVLFSSCDSKTTSLESASIKDEHGHEGEAGPKELAIFTSQQVEATGLETGSFQQMKLAGYIKANGMLDLPPSNQATINPPHQGFVEKTRFLEGDYVKKGTVLAELSHPDYLLLQQEYLEVNSRLTFLTQELERQRTLAAANVSAQKRLQEIESEFNAMTVRQLGLKERLGYIGIVTQKLSTGSMQRRIAIRAPFSGYITKVNIRLGTLVGPEITMYEMVDNRHMHLELKVFEKDLFQVKKGQRITFRLPTQGNKSYEGEVHLIGREFDQENRTVNIHSHLEGEHPEFVRGLYAEAQIWLDARTVPALPESAIISDEGKSYIFIEQHEHDEEQDDHDEKQYRKVLVRTGVTENGFTEVYPVESLRSDAEIVLSGAYYLMAEMNKGEAEHSH
ncbi:MAG: efflux RND transporter periplasmic adaptor subunit [Bacteroidia bacterium]|nr:efflux RND transporter periplasmic adaptor subunit [Bacteroidia bacterium]